MGRKTKAVTRALMEAMIQTATGAKTAMPMRSTVHDRVSSVSSTSSRKRVMASPGVSSRAWAPGSS
jgi:hypothetical protein